MKAGLLAAAAVIATGVSAGTHHAARHVHEKFHLEDKRWAENATTCLPQCTTIYETITGKETWYFSTPSPSTSAPAPPATSAAAPTKSTVVVVPTPYVTVCAATPGTCVIPATTLTVTSTVILVSPTPTTITPGTYTQPATTCIVKELETITVFYTCEATAAPTATYVAPAPPATTSAKSSPSSAPQTGGLGSSGSRWGVTYTAYTKTGECKSAEGVLADIEKVAKAGFTTVRVYSTDCRTLEYVGAACETHGLKIIIGVFVTSAGLAACEEQVQAILAWGKWELVVGVILANEAIFNGYCTAGALVGFIQETTTALKAAGCHAPISVAETLNIWQSVGSQICDYIDFIAVNVQPYFNQGTAAGHAGSFVASQLELAETVCPGKLAYNTECGWPKEGPPNGLAIPGTSEQCDAIASIQAEVGGRTLLFTLEDTLWKSDPLEQSFGFEGCL